MNITKKLILAVTALAAISGVSTPSVAQSVETTAPVGSIINRCVRDMVIGLYRYERVRIVLITDFNGRQVRGTLILGYGQRCNPRTGQPLVSTTPRQPPIYYYPSLESQLALGNGAERVACHNGVPQVISAGGVITSYPQQRCAVGDRRRNRALAQN